MPDQPQPAVTITVSQLETALRSWLTDVDYDIHKAMQCDEETGEDTYPDEAETVFAHLQRLTASAAAEKSREPYRYTDADGDYLHIGAPGQPANGGPAVSFHTPTEPVHVPVEEIDALIAALRRLAAQA